MLGDLISDFSSSAGRERTGEEGRDWRGAEAARAGTRLDEAGQPTVGQLGELREAAARRQREQQRQRAGPRASRQILALPIQLVAVKERLSQRQSRTALPRWGYLCFNFAFQE